MTKRLLLLLTLLAAAAPLWAQDSTDVATQVASRGIFLTLISVFVAGIGVSLTPCLYPMIPITLSVIGANAVGQKPMHGFLRAFTFVLGIAVVYTLIGVATSMLGVSLTRILQFKAFWLFLAVFFGLMGLSMFGLFELQLPPSVAAKLQGKTAGKSGFIGAFLVGLVTGVAASPCGSPVLAGLAVYAADQAKDGHVASSILMFFVYAMGMGMLFMVLGTFPALLKNMPRSGGWMEDVKKMLGAVLIGVAIYYLQFAFPRGWMPGYWMIVIGALVAAAVIVAMRAGYRRRYPVLFRAWQITGLLCALAAVYVASTKLPEAFKAKAAQDRKRAGQVAAKPQVKADEMMVEAKTLLANDAQFTQRAKPVAVAVAANGAADGATGATPAEEPKASEATEPAPADTADADAEHGAWIADEKEGLALARKLNKPVVVDFGAVWCAACKQLEDKTFPVPEVAKVLEEFVLIRIDASDDSDPEVLKLQEKYGAQSLPSVSFLTPAGKHLKQFDLKAFEKPEKFLQRLEKVKAALK